MAENWVVFCVHGVGDSEPSDLVDAVAPAVCAVRGVVLPKPDQYEMVRLPDGKETDFPVYMRRAAMGDARVLFAELFWADLSRAKPGFFGFLLALFLLVFGIRHIADQAAAQKGWPARVLRALLLTVANLLRGPLFALYLLATAYALIYLAAEGLRVYWPAIDLRAAPASGVAFALLGAAAVVAGLRLWRESGRRDLLSATPWLSFAVVGALAVAAAVATLAWPVDLAAAGQNSAVPAPLGWLLRKFHEEFAAVDLSSRADFYLAATVWAAGAVLAVISALMLAALVPLGMGWLLGPTELRRALTAAYLAEGLQIAFWVLLVTPLDWLTTCALVIRLNWADTKPYWNDLTIYVFLQLVFLLTIVATAAAVWGARLRWAGRSTPAVWRPDGQAPRLIVGAPIELAVLACSLTFFLFTVWVACSYDFDWPSFLAPVSVVVGLIVAAVLTALLFWPGPVRFGLHVVTDVISHFQRRGNRFPLRERIQARFHCALRRLLDVEDPSHVLVIAHSQGTIIALEALLDRELAEKLRGRTVALATFGSPFTHLYQHYFPWQYEALSRGRWRILARLGWPWRNLFRIDDYVGTYIDSSDPAWPINVPLPAGFALAHTSYWQTGIFQLVADLLPPLGEDGFIGGEGI